MAIKRCTIVKWTKYDNTIILINNTVAYNITMPIIFCTTFMTNRHPDTTLISIIDHKFNFSNSNYTSLFLISVSTYNMLL